MSITKLKLDPTTGTIEVEGDEKVVMEIYRDYKESLFLPKAASGQLDESKVALPLANVTNSTSDKQEATPKKKRRSNKEQYDDSVLGFDLEDVNSLRSFYESKNPQSGFERNAVFVFFMQKKKNMTGITPGHIYGCYNVIGVRFPAALKQSILDTSNKKKWLDSSDTNNITLTLAGEAFVSHNLPSNKE